MVGASCGGLAGARLTALVVPYGAFFPLLPFLPSLISYTNSGNALGIVYRPCERHKALFPDPAGAWPIYSFFAGSTDSDPPFPFAAPAAAPPLPSRDPLPVSPMYDIDALEPLESPKY